MRYGGGWVFTRAKIVLVLRGPGWATGLPMAADVERAFSAILASPFASQLVQYGGIRRPKLVDVVIDTKDIGHLGPDPRGFLTTQVRVIDTSDIVQAVKEARLNGRQEPIPGDVLYLVIISVDPMGVFSEDRYQNAAGFHDQFHADMQSITYGAVLNWSNNTAANIWNSRSCLPAVLCHEMVEALTDPDTTTGFRLDNGNEIADLNDVRPVQLPGITQTLGLPAYWSDLETKAVAPTTYSFRTTFGFRPNDRIGSVRGLVGPRSVLAAMRDVLEP